MTGDLFTEFLRDSYAFRDLSRCTGRSHIPSYSPFVSRWFVQHRSVLWFGFIPRQMERKIRRPLAPSLTSKPSSTRNLAPVLLNALFMEILLLDTLHEEFVKQ
jgi:hypothetical protein